MTNVNEKQKQYNTLKNEEVKIGKPSLYLHIYQPLTSKDIKNNFVFIFTQNLRVKLTGIITKKLVEAKC